jgi:signal transduction histidine kinase
MHDSPIASEDTATVGELQQEILRLRTELLHEKAQAEVRTRIFRLLSHEFRTPLTVILSSTELLQVYGERWASEKRGIHLGRIASSVELLSSLLDDVLLFNRLQADAVEVMTATYPQPLQEFLQDVVSGTENAGRVSLECPEIQTRLDTSLLRTILRNLLSNALRYTKGGVFVHASQDASELILQVDDEGPGFPPSEAKALFEPFFRGVRSQGTPGTGLGLAVVQQCVILLGGTINYQSLDCGGTRFIVKLKEQA